MSISSWCKEPKSDETGMGLTFIEFIVSLWEEEVIKNTNEDGDLLWLVSELPRESTACKELA